MQPQTMTLPPPCLTVGQTHLSLFSWNHVLWSDETKINLFCSDGVKRVWWQPGVQRQVCLSSANCLRAFLCIIFRRGFLLGRQPCRPIWCSVQRMIWALTGWPPTPSTSASMLAALIRLFSKHNLWTWRWARVLNFFGLPFLSETCPVKPLYGLGHRAAAQFQGLGKLLISYAIFM